MREEVKIQAVSEERLNFIAEMIIEKFRGSKKQELIIVGIGTDKAIFDAIGCLNGTLLRDYDSNLKVYGTLDSPIHALNIHDKFDIIKNNHKNAFIVAVDACLGRYDELNQVVLRDLPIKAGRGVGKELPPIGDMSLIGIIGDAESDYRALHSVVRLDTVFKLTKIITYILLRVDEIINDTYFNKSKLIYQDVV